MLGALKAIEDYQQQQLQSVSTSVRCMCAPFLWGLKLNKNDDNDDDDDNDDKVVAVIHPIFHSRGIPVTVVSIFTGNRRDQLPFSRFRGISLIPFSYRNAVQNRKNRAQRHCSKVLMIDFCQSGE